MTHTKFPVPFYLLAAASLTLTACGGGDSDAGSGGQDNQPPTSGTCSVSDEKDQLLDYMYENYLWAEDLATDINPQNYADAYELLANITVPWDRYSFLLTEQEYQDRYVNASFAGLGFSSVVTNNNDVMIRYVYDDSPAGRAGIKRSDRITAINGVEVATLIAQGSLNDAFGPSEVGVTVELEWQNTEGENFSDVLDKENINTNTVFAPQTYELGGSRVGYYVLDSFINRTGQDLNEAYDLFADAQINELVIDVRYNGGGLIRFANQASSQAAGNNVLGETFVTYAFNEQNQNFNQTELFELGEGVQQLDLDRVFVLTTGASCSSSELIINSLSPFVEVVAIGEQTCGKPVGQMPEPLCDKRTFVVNFETVNALGDGQYYDGIAPTCAVTEQIVGDWGDPQDPLLATANNYIDTGTCGVSGQQSLRSMSHLENASQETQRPVTLPEKWRTEH